MVQGRKIYYSRTQLYCEILQDWCLMAIAILMIFTALVVLKWVPYGVHKVEITLEDVAWWIEDNFYKSAFIGLVVLYLTTAQYLSMRERKSLTYRYGSTYWNNPYGPHKSDSFRTDSDWDEYERSVTTRFRQ